MTTLINNLIKEHYKLYELNSDSDITSENNLNLKFNFKNIFKQTNNKEHLQKDVLKIATIIDYQKQFDILLKISNYQL